MASEDKALTPMQEAFCKHMALLDENGIGKTQSQAYQDSHPDAAEHTARVESTGLMKDQRIRDRIKELSRQSALAFFEERVPLSRLLKKLEEGLEATVTKTASEKGKITDKVPFIDFPTRRNYIELALKIRGEFPSERSVVSHEFSNLTDQQLIETAKSLFGRTS